MIPLQFSYNIVKFSLVIHVGGFVNEGRIFNRFNVKLVLGINGIFHSMGKPWFPSFISDFYFLERKEFIV